MSSTIGSTGSTAGIGVSRFLILATLIASCTATVASLAGRSVYFVVTDRFTRDDANRTSCGGSGHWCGGSFRGLISQLDYIQGMGFDCVWITPVVKQLGGISCNTGGYCGVGYHGYWAEDWWAIDPHLGTSEDLQLLSTALHARSMCLVLDVVANHVRPLHSAANVSAVVPFNSLDHYHTLHMHQGETFDEYCQHPASCLVNSFAPGCRLGEVTCAGYNATQVEQGWFASLGDLKHEHPFVRTSLLRWVRQMVHNYSVDALRLDTAPYVPKAFLSDFQRAAGVDILGEVTAANLSFHGSYQMDRTKGGAVLHGLLNFPLAWTVPAAFCGVPSEDSHAFDMRDLGGVLQHQQLGAHYSNLDLLGNFADNHDGPRLAKLCAGDASRVAHSLAFIMLTRGVPIVYYGTEHGFAQEDNRAAMWPTGFGRDTPLYKLLAELNAVRREHRIAQRGRPVALVHADVAHLVLSRGDDVWIYLHNLGRAAARTPIAYCSSAKANVVPPPPPSGLIWIDALSGGQVATFNESCFLAADGAPKVLVLGKAEAQPRPH